MSSLPLDMTVPINFNMQHVCMQHMQLDTNVTATHTKWQASQSQGLFINASDSNFDMCSRAGFMAISSLFSLQMTIFCIIFIYLWLF